jgi:hypothetical protein
MDAPKGTCSELPFPFPGVENPCARAKIHKGRVQFILNDRAVGLDYNLLNQNLQENILDSWTKAESTGRTHKELQVEPHYAELSA